MNENIFTTKADSYVQGRKGYAPKAIELLLGIKSDIKTVADIGSGTGILSAEFISRGINTYCVEPNNAMRKKAEARFKGSPFFFSINGTAENTTLENASVDLVSVGSAYHWFNSDLFNAECKRILKTDGIFFALNNARDYLDEFTIRQHSLCQKYCDNYTSLKHGIDKSVEGYSELLGDNLNYAEFYYPIEYTKNEFVQRSMSSSYAPQLNTDNYNKYLSELNFLLNEFYPNTDVVSISNKTIVHWGVPI